MLDALWHLRGTVELRGSATNQQVLAGLEQLLDEQRKSPERGSSTLYFEAPLWDDPFTGGSRAMAIYDRGQFWIDRDLSGSRLRYDLRSLHVLVFCLIGAAMFFLFGIQCGGVFSGLKYAGIAFGWIYGMNLLLAFVRVPSAIKKAARTS